MKFVEVGDLKTGMRLARPIYNKSGVLLFERDSKLSSQIIDNIMKFGLLGLYILEPAEPLPPMSEEDLEFEQFQIRECFAIQDEMEKIMASGKQSRLQTIVSVIIKNYGHRDEKTSFYQNLRSKDDYISRHALNTAMLCAMIAHSMNVRVDQQVQAVTAALLHDIGKQNVPPEVLFGKSTEENDARIYDEQLQGLEVIENVEGVAIKRICMQVLRAQYDFTYLNKVSSSMKMVTPARILLVANRYDELTAMDLQGRSKSEVKALYEFQEHPELYDSGVVDALIDCVHILFPGVSIELSTGEKALVLSANEADVLRPIVLTFNHNNIIDLSSKENQDIKIVDIMKTLDNRYVMDIETLERMKQGGGENAFG